MEESTLRWPTDKEREEMEEVCSRGEVPHTEKAVSDFDTGHNAVLGWGSEDLSRKVSISMHGLNELKQRDNKPAVYTLEWGKQDTGTDFFYILSDGSHA